MKTLTKNLVGFPSSHKNVTGTDVGTKRLLDTHLPALTVTDLDGQSSITVLKGKQLENLFTLINSAGFLDGETYDGFLCEENTITDFKTFHFFNLGNEVFSIVLGFNSDTDIGALKVQPSSTISKFFFVQGLNLGDEPMGSTLGALFAIGGVNVAFTILQDSSGFFEIADGNLVKSLVSVPEGTYTLLIKAEGDTSQYIDQVTIIVLATALISNINLSGSIVEDTAPIGTSVGALSTQGGANPITYTIVSQTLAGFPVDLFEITANVLVTKALVGITGDSYDVFIQAEDSRVALPDNERLKVEQFPILVVEDTFINTRSLSFDGIDEFLNVPYHISLYTSNKLTISSWVKISTTAGEKVIVSQFGAAGSRGYRFSVLSANLYINISENGSNSLSFNTTNSPIAINTWYHTSMVFDGDNNTIKLYIDGVEVLSSAIVYNTYKNVLEPTRIGARGDSSSPETSFFSGLLEETSMYDEALTPAQITEIYNSGLPRNLTSIGSASSLIAWWRMGDLFTGTIDPDQIGSNDATGVNINNSNRSTDVPV